MSVGRWRKLLGEIYEIRGGLLKLLKLCSVIALGCRGEWVNSEGQVNLRRVSADNIGTGWWVW